jgi:hypothetical protein
MRHVTLSLATLVTMIASSFVLVGCAGQPSHAMSPDPNDPAWQPPGEMSVTMHSSPASANTSSNTNTALAAAPAPQPNKREIRNRQIKAAMY